jgi:hypothetical protein
MTSDVTSVLNFDLDLSFNYQANDRDCNKTADRTLGLTRQGSGCLRSYSLEKF